MARSILTKQFLKAFLKELGWRCIAWAVLPFILRKAVPDTTGIVPKMGEPGFDAHPEVPRYTLPDKHRWMQCQDDVLPPCMYEPDVYQEYREEGWKVCTWSNLAFRNVGSGIMWKLGRPVRTYMALMPPEEREEAGVYDNCYRIWPFYLLVGYVVYRDIYSVSTNNGFWAVPRITLRAKKP